MREPVTTKPPPAAAPIVPASWRHRGAIVPNEDRLVIAGCGMGISVSERDDGSAGLAPAERKDVTRDFVISEPGGNVRSARAMHGALSGDVTALAIVETPLGVFFDQRTVGEIVL